jgi:hypothetical protein
MPVIEADENAEEITLQLENWIPFIPEEYIDITWKDAITGDPLQTGNNNLQVVIPASTLAFYGSQGLQATAWNNFNFPIISVLFFASGSAPVGIPQLKNVEGATEKHSDVIYVNGKITYNWHYYSINPNASSINIILKCKNTIPTINWDAKLYGNSSLNINVSTDKLVASIVPANVPPRGVRVEIKYDNGTQYNIPVDTLIIAPGPFDLAARIPKAAIPVMEASINLSNAQKSPAYNDLTSKVTRSDGNWLWDSETGGFAEAGGVWGIINNTYSIVATKVSTAVDPRANPFVQIYLFNRNSYDASNGDQTTFDNISQSIVGSWHVHCSGKMTAHIEYTNTFRDFFFTQLPIASPKNPYDPGLKEINIVIGAYDHMVYFYNYWGDTIGCMKWSDFKPYVLAHGKS